MSGRFCNTTDSINGNVKSRSRNTRLPTGSLQAHFSYHELNRSEEVRALGGLGGDQVTPRLA
jgi:hypothetical protein